MAILSDRRKFIRLEIPIDVSYIMENDNILRRTSTKNISAEGLRFTCDNSIKDGAVLEIKLNFSNLPNPIHIRGKVIWCKKLSLEDGMPYDIGVEFLKIEEDNKNTFLKFICDVIYNQAKKMGAA